MEPNRFTVRILMAGLVALVLAGCTSKPPTIAHVHVGHAITGAHDTPGGEGYFVLAERRAEAARDLAARRLAGGGPPEALQRALEELNEIVNTGASYPLGRALEESISHIEFAAESADASPNVRRSAAEFKRNSEGVLYRASLVNLYVQDAVSSTTAGEVEQLAGEVSRLVTAIVQGEDLDGNGSIGDSPREFGMVQLRGELEAMIGREDPPYTTVDRWYLLNLVRMPSGEWIFRRSGTQGGANY